MVIICPTCRGSKQVIISELIIACDYQYTQEYGVPCQTCNEVGWIDDSAATPKVTMDELAQWIKNAQESNDVTPKRLADYLRSKGVKIMEEHR